MNPPLDVATLLHIVGELERSESLQAEKVIALARRIRPGLTNDDLKNPHDFPDLDDPDWHYADGQLTAYQAILTLLRTMLHEAR